jgi:elongation factor 1-alpha
MLCQVGWKKAVADEQIPFIPVAAWHGENLLHKSDCMPWWAGSVVQAGEGPQTVMTLASALNEAISMPQRTASADFCMPITNVLKIKGVGSVVTGRIAEGSLVAGGGVHLSNEQGSWVGKVASCEMHHERIDSPSAGDIVGINLKGLDSDRMPKIGDVLFLRNNAPRRVRSFVAEIQVLNVTTTHGINEIRLGYSPTIFVHTSRSSVRLTKIHWRLGHGTGGEKIEDSKTLHAHDVARVELQPLQDLCVLPYSQCQALARFALVDGWSIELAIGKVVSCEY